MRKSLIALLILFVSLAVMAPTQAFAAPSAGVKPGSIFYFFDLAFEKISLLLTINPEKKIQKERAYAEERLAEKEENARAVEEDKEGNEEVVPSVAPLKVDEAKSEAPKETEETKIKEKNKRKPETPAKPVSIPAPTPAKPAAPQSVKAESPANAARSVTLPNGAVAEIGANGEITRFIKEAPTKSVDNLVSDLSSQIDILKKQNTEAERQRVAQQKILEEQQKTLEKIKENTTPPPPYIPPPPPPPESIAHEFSVRDENSQFNGCTVRSDGKAICTADIKLQYKMGRISEGLKASVGATIDMSVSSLNYTQRAETTSHCASQSEVCIYADFRVQNIEKGGTYPVTFSVNGQTYNYDLKIEQERIDNWKASRCRYSGAFCESKDIAWLDMTPRAEKIVVENSAATYGRIKLFGVANFKIDAESPGYAHHALVRETDDVFNGQDIAFDYERNEFYLAYKNQVKPGTYTMTIKDIRIQNKDNIGGSGPIKFLPIAGLPISFTYTVK